MWNALNLSGWGRNPHARVEACRPERRREVLLALRERRRGGLIAYGAGRSYGDAALNERGQVLLTARLNRMESFDPVSGELVCEAGVSFLDLLRTFLPKGFVPPVVPGTAFATLGGGVATDVHGKNHDRAGSLGEHVRWLDLALPSGEVIRISPKERPEWFAATVGGVGLTGIIVRLCLGLARAPSAWVTKHEHRIADLDQFLESLEANRTRSTYSVGWIDTTARGASLGRGILETADPAVGSGLKAPVRRTRAVPVDFPSGALNPWSVELFNQLYWRRVPPGGRVRTVPLEDFLLPLDALDRWNRIYGRRGFYQFQCVLLDAEAQRGVPRLLEAVAKTGRASFLSVLKTLGGEGRGHLSFPMRGYTLALDFPNAPGVDDLLGRLERITLDHGGRVYLAKDARLSPGGFAAMYPKLERFREALGELDPEGRMQSDMARRLRIRDLRV
jgi:decaprenylphospho-beta-D-ribofuranose 2-oxidase